ncbi:hypothetical protein BDR07DRAFT_1489640 [Suillus spraguei]|nr:hypothetical protein BDR07DRAFT_1489640 [Suillus spraguei]
MTSYCGVEVIVRRPTPSNARRYTLLLIFCITQFLYALTNSTLFSAIPTLVRKLGFTQSQSVWIISGVPVGFCIPSPYGESCLPVADERIFTTYLRSGKISGIYTPKYTFITGKFIVGVISIGLGFVSDGILFLAMSANRLRSFAAIARTDYYSRIAHRTIGSSLALRTFP